LFFLSQAAFCVFFVLPSPSGSPRGRERERRERERERKRGERKRGGREKFEKAVSAFPCELES